MRKLLDSKFNFLLFIFILFASLISVANVGNQFGIYAPSNISVFGAVGLFIASSLLIVCNKKKIQHNSLVVFIFIVFSSLLLIGLINSSYEQVELTLYAMLIGVLFIFAVLQVRLTEQHWFWFFYFVIILGVFQSVIALVQQFDAFGILYLWTGYFPFKFNNYYLGSLQHINMLASLLAFVVVVSIWLIFNRTYNQLNPILKLLVWLSFALAIVVISGSGSRVGMLGWVLGSFVVAYALRASIKQHIHLFWLLLAIAFLAFLIGASITSGYEQLGDKVERIAYGGDVRMFLLSSGLDIFLQNFWFGVGIGNYSEVFREYVLNNGLFLDVRIVSFDINRFTHPHNEPLYWLIQSGIIGVAPLLLGIILVFVNWLKQGLNKFLIYFAISFPLLLQIMVSYPTILSALHYFLVLILLTWSLKLPSKQFLIPSIRGLTFTIKSMATALSLLIFYGLYLGWMSTFETYYFKNRIFLYKVYPQQELKGYFFYASKFKLYENMVLMNMENLFLKAIEKRNYYDLNQYLIWYENYNGNLPIRFNEYALNAKSMVANAKYKNAFN